MAHSSSAYVGGPTGPDCLRILCLKRDAERGTVAIEVGAFSWNAECRQRAGPFVLDAKLDRVTACDAVRDSSRHRRANGTPRAADVLKERRVARRDPRHQIEMGIWTGACGRWCWVVRKQAGGAGMVDLESRAGAHRSRDSRPPVVIRLRVRRRSLDRRERPQAVTARVIPIMLVVPAQHERGGTRIELRQDADDSGCQWTRGLNITPAARWSSSPGRQRRTTHDRG